MIINDPVYSIFEITSPVIIDLINTTAFQRLKGVNQYGMPDKYYHLNGYTRYEHSLGVFILLTKLGASEKEQVAGLLHDVSHTAFSHLVDWVVGDASQEDFQDNQHLDILQQPELEQVLSQYGYTPEEMADYHEFTLLEQDAPDLCADRIDYALREFPIEVAQQCLEGLSVSGGQIVFATKESALLFAENFLSRQEQHWGGYEAVTRYTLLAQLLKMMLEHGELKISDFQGTDETVIEKIIQTGKPEYLEILTTLEQDSLEDLPRSRTKAIKKFRYVDPLFLSNGKLQRLSDVDSHFKQLLLDAEKRNENGVFPGFLNQSFDKN